MSLAEAHAKPIFGPITIEDMQKSEPLTRLALKVVAEACKHTKGRYSAQSIAAGLASGEFRLWGVLTPPAELEAAIVTRTDGKTLELIVQGPDIHDVLPFLGVLEGYAKRQGCERIMLSGPKFFDRLLPDEWRIREVKFERVLAPG